MALSAWNDTPRLITERYRPRLGLLENPPAPGLPDLQAFPSNNSFLSNVHLWGLPGDFRAPLPGEGNLYTTPADLAGVGGVYLDLSGQPRFILNQTAYPLMGTPFELRLPPPYGYVRTANAAQDDPYELDLLTMPAGDSLISEEELEELLRFNDMDVQMMRESRRRCRR